MIHELRAPIPVLTPRGPGYCFAWFDYSQEHETLWLVCMDATGEWWQVPQSQVRAQKNYSMGRVEAPSAFKVPFQPIE